MNKMKFTENGPYPKFNPDNDKTPGIPNWKRSFGNYTVSFTSGEKKYEGRKECGDYIIHVSPPIGNGKNTNFKDTDLWRILESELNKINKDELLETLYQILHSEVESEVYKYISQSSFKKEIKIVLYTLWHRAIIEDRIYPPPKYQGRKRIIGITYGLIEKKYDANKAYKMGKSTEETVKKEIEKLYQEFEQKINK